MKQTKMKFTTEIETGQQREIINCTRATLGHLDLSFSITFIMNYDLPNLAGIVDVSFTP